MTRNTVKKGLLHKAVAATLLCFSVLSVTGCSVDKNQISALHESVYAKTKDGKYQVTNVELYKELRYSGYDYLTRKIDEAVLSDEISLVKKIYNNESDATHGYYTSKEKVQNDLDKTILNAIYGTSEEDEIKGLTDKSKNQSIQQFIVNTQNNYNIKITEDEIKTNDFKKLYDIYFVEVAKKALAYNELLSDIDEAKTKADKDELYSTDKYDAYFTNSSIESFYEENFINQKDVQGLLIRFYNQEEADATFKAFGLKSYNDQLWYLANATNSKEEANQNPNLTYIEDWYEKTTIDLNDKNTIAVSLGATDANETSTEKVQELSKDAKAKTLAIYIEMYNYVYKNYRTPIVYENRNITSSDNTLDIVGKILDNNNLDYDQMVNALLSSEQYSDELTKSRDDIDAYSTTLTSYVYNTLKTEAPKNTSKENNFDYSYQQFSTKATSYGSSYFMYFKLGYEEDEELYSKNDDGTLNKPNSDNEDYKYNESVYNQVIEDMIDDKLTSSFIETKMDEAIENVKVSIYDTVLNAQHKLQDENYHSTKKSSKTDVFKLEYEQTSVVVTIDEYYEYLENRHGSQVAVELLAEKAIKDTPYYEAAKKNVDVYKDNLQSILGNFANNSLSSYGFPASMGKTNFMLLYFRSTDVNEIVDRAFVTEEALSNYRSDMNVKLINEFTNYSEKLFDEFYSSSMKQVVVFYDGDDNAKADDYSNLSQDQQQKLEDLMKKLLQEIQNELKVTAGSHATALTNIVNEYNSTARRTVNDYAFAPENKWSEYKSYGLYIELRDLEVNNDSDQKEEILNQVEKVYNSIDDQYRLYGTFPTEYLDETILEIDVKNIISSKEVNAKEFSFLLFTGGTDTSSSKFDQEDDEDSAITINGEKQNAYSRVPILYKDKEGNKYVTYLNAYSNDDYITVNQAQIYLYQTLELGNVVGLPESVLTAMEAYFTPILERYSDSNNVVNLYDFLLGGTDTTYALTFVKQEDQEQYETYLTNTRKVLDNFNQETNYIYNNWWNMLSNNKGDK